MFRQQTRSALESRRRSEEIVRLKTAELEDTNAAIAKLQQELVHHLCDHTTGEGDAALKVEMQPLESETGSLLLTVANQDADASRAQHQVQLARERAHHHGAARATAEVSALPACVFLSSSYLTLFLDCASN